MLELCSTLSDGTGHLYVNGVLDGSTAWYYPGIQ